MYLRGYSLEQLAFAQEADILSEEGEGAVFALQAGGDLGGVPAAHVVHGEVGGDDGLALRRQAAVDEGVECGLDEGGDQLAAQVV